MNRIGYLLSAALLAFTAGAQANTLYSQDSYRPLASDRRAQRIGDVITVLVVENSSAAASAGTSTDKSHNAGISVTTPSRTRNHGLGVTDDFDGNGKISRTGRLLAQLSVSIVGVEPNGDLRIKGDQNLEINGEKQAITLEGRIRPVDISETNTVSSTRISEAKITYIGDGVLADSQSKGWLSKILFFLGLL